MIQRQPTRRRLFRLGATLLAGLLLFAPSARAHAIIVSSTPSPNSTVPQGRFDILLQFNSRIDVALSRISLVDPAGKVSALATSAGNVPGSLAAEGNADSLGPWILRWQVLSVDGHITRGEIRFLVVAKTAS